MKNLKGFATSIATTIYLGYFNIIQMVARWCGVKLNGRVANALAMCEYGWEVAQILAPYAPLGIPAWLIKALVVANIASL